MLLKALSIAHLRFVGPQPLQMLAKSISNQRRAVYFRMLGGLVGARSRSLSSTTWIVSICGLCSTQNTTVKPASHSKQRENGTFVSAPAVASQIPNLSRSTQTPPTNPASRALALIYSFTVGLSAFLLFLVEPLFAKIILPWFGGSAAVWTVCLVFFQSALLLGYFYADLCTRRLRPRRQVPLHIALLALSLPLLPLSPGSFWRPGPGEDPSWRILGLLTAAIGLPYVLLSTTSPLVQSWCSRRLPKSDPYRLFALSNLASLAALLSYPFLIEPRSSTHVQSLAWSAGFALFVAVCVLAAWSNRSSVYAQPLVEEMDGGKPGWRMLALWIALAACGSMLLLTITNHLSQNVAPVPLLWVLPLSLYLLTFALAFSRRSFYPRSIWMRLLAVTLGAIGYAIHDPRTVEAIQISVPLFCGGLFVCCLFCHGELSRLKPRTAHLTSFYLMLALGGALGAIFVGLVAPHIFSNLYEFPLTLLFTALLALITMWREGWAARALWAVAAAAMAIVVVVNVRGYEENSLVMVRSFYGALRVTQTRDIGPQQARMLYHGTIRHGAQFLLPPKREEPTAYYSRDSGIGFALRYCCDGPKRVGVLGLGVGTLAAYGRRGDYFRFYEINPQVVSIAQNVFTYLRESPARIDITLGDARLSLERETPQRFDVLAIDAFSGDAIPVHLLTREAMAIYFRHLKPDGILAFHTSNSYLQLAPVVKQLANSFGYPARMIENEPDEDNLVSTADWVLVTRNQQFLNLPIIERGQQPVHIPADLRPWTDDYNNLFQILKPIKFFDQNSD